MNTWIISANPATYKHDLAFKEQGFIDWRQALNPLYDYTKGDIVYIYCTEPEMKIMYKTEVAKIGLPKDEIKDKKKYWVDKSNYKSADKYVRLRLLAKSDSDKLAYAILKKKFKFVAPQGIGKYEVKGKMLEYIEKCFNKNKKNDFSIVEPKDLFPDEDIPKQYIEGAEYTIMVNKYERNMKARQKCIEKHGIECSICGLNFEKYYGKVGAGFIHVHHIKPLSEINEEYKVNPEKDLIPVCPNCHAMLHRQINGEYISVKQLKNIVKKKKTRIK